MSHSHDDEPHWKHHGVRVVSIRLWETPQSSALWTAK